MSDLPSSFSAILPRSSELGSPLGMHIAAKSSARALSESTPPSAVLLDLEGLSFIDSSGLAALVAAFKAATEAGGTLKLARLAPQVAQVFSLTRLDRVFEISAGSEEALASFRE